MASMIDDRIQLAPPLHLVSSETTCWRCGAVMSVVAILCENTTAEDEGPFILSSIAKLPPELGSYVRRYYPTFRLTFSKTLGDNYFVNNCPRCGVIFGDFYLHDEPGAPFFPTDPEEAECLTIEEIPINRTVSVRAGCGYGTGDLILEHAKRISRKRR